MVSSSRSTAGEREMPDPFTSVPENWRDATPFYGKAMDVTLAALQHPDACSRLKRYYSHKGNYAGATFVEIGPFNPYAFTEGHLLALTLLELYLAVKPAVSKDGSTRANP
jgi:hypothetical protein